MARWRGSAKKNFAWLALVNDCNQVLTGVTPQLLKPQDSLHKESDHTPFQLITNQSTPVKHQSRMGDHTVAHKALAGLSTAKMYSPTFHRHTAQPLAD